MGQLCATKHPQDIDSASKPSNLSHKQKHDSFIEQWLANEKNKDLAQIPPEQLEFIFVLEQCEQGKNDLIQTEFLTIIAKNENQLNPEDFINCGIVLEVLGNFQEAEKYFIKSLEKVNEGEYHAACLYNLAIISQKQGKLEESEKYFEQCIQIIKSTNLEEKELGYIYNNLGYLYLKKQKEKEAQEQFASSLQIWQKKFGKVGLIDWFNCMQNSSTNYPIIKQNNIIIKLVKQTIEQLMQTQTIQEQSQEMIYILNQYARIFQKFFLYESAFVCILQCLELSNKIYDTENYDKIILMTNLGQLYYLLNQIEDSGKYLEQSFQWFEKIQNQDQYQKELAFLAQILAIVFKELGIVQKSEIYQKKGQQVTKRLKQKYLFQ